MGTCGVICRTQLFEGGDVEDPSAQQVCCLSLSANHFLTYLFFLIRVRRGVKINAVRNKLLGHCCLQERLRAAEGWYGASRGCHQRTASPPFHLLRARLGPIFLRSSCGTAEGEKNREILPISFIIRGPRGDASCRDEGRIRTEQEPYR